MPDSGEQRFRARVTSRISPVSPAAPDAAARLLAEPGYGDDLRDYLAPLLLHGKLLAMITVLATLAAFAFSKYQLTRWYQAIAIIKPMTPQQTAGHLQGLLGGANLGTLSDFVGGQYNSDAAQEYITILTSFSFVTAMVEQHHLDAELLPPGTSYSSSDARQWAMYRIMLGRLRCDYSVKNSSITLSFEDPSRERARRILGYEIDDLRAKLRSREVRNAADAVASLNQQVKKISDTLLVREIYELIATQIQRQELAEIEADFAFTVLQPPVSPDLPVWPRVLVNALGAGFIALVLSSIYILLIDAWRESRRRKSFPVEPVPRSQFSENSNEAGVATAREQPTRSLPFSAIRSLFSPPRMSQRTTGSDGYCWYALPVSIFRLYSRDPVPIPIHFESFAPARRCSCSIDMFPLVRLATFPTKRYVEFFMRSAAPLLPTSRPWRCRSCCSIPSCAFANTSRCRIDICSRPRWRFIRSIGPVLPAPSISSGRWDASFSASACC